MGDFAAGRLLTRGQDWILGRERESEQKMNSKLHFGDDQRVLCRYITHILSKFGNTFFHPLTGYIPK